MIVVKRNRQCIIERFSVYVNTDSRYPDTPIVGVSGIYAVHTTLFS
nr:MAG TPA: hypothetical protein [Caudoviricetes sp.]